MVAQKCHHRPPPHSSLGTECPPELSVQLLSPLPILALQTSPDPLFLSVWETIFTNVFLLPEFPLALQGLSSLLVSMGLHSTWELLGERGLHQVWEEEHSHLRGSQLPCPCLLSPGWSNVLCTCPSQGVLKSSTPRSWASWGAALTQARPPSGTEAIQGEELHGQGKPGQRTPPLRLTLAAPSRGFHVTLCMCVWLG